MQFTHPFKVSIIFAIIITSLIQPIQSISCDIGNLIPKSTTKLTSGSQIITTPGFDSCIYSLACFGESHEFVSCHKSHVFTYEVVFLGYKVDDEKSQNGSSMGITHQCQSHISSGVKKVALIPDDSIIEECCYTEKCNLSASIESLKSIQLNSEKHVLERDFGEYTILDETLLKQDSAFHDKQISKSGSTSHFSTFCIIFAMLSSFFY